MNPRPKDARHQTRVLRSGARGSLRSALIAGGPELGVYGTYPNIGRGIDGQV